MKQYKSKKFSLSVVEISMRAKSLYLSTLPIIDRDLFREYMAVIYPNEKVTLEKVTPIANFILLKYIWWYLKLFKTEISDNENQFELFKHTLFSLFEKNFKFSPAEIIHKVNQEVPDDVFETNWFERETVKETNKYGFGVLESLSAVAVEKHFSLAKKLWEEVWKVNVDELSDFTGNLVRETLQDYISKAKN